MEEQPTCVNQKSNTDMMEDSESTDIDHAMSSDEEKQKECKIFKQEEDNAREKKELETTTLHTQADGMDDLGAGLDPKSMDLKDKNIATRGDNGRGMPGDLPPKNTGVLKKEEEDISQQKNNIESIGPSFHDSKVPVVTGGLIDEGNKDKNEQPDTTSSSTQANRKDEEVDSYRPEIKEESPDFEDTNAEPDHRGGEECACEDMDMPKNEEEEELNEQKTKAETIGHTPQDITESALPEVTAVPAGMMRYLIAAVAGVVIAILVGYFFQSEPLPRTTDVRQIDIFLTELEKVKFQFPAQRAELWNRSRIHLQRHLQTAQPTEPVSLILTAGLRAERTMQCLAQGLASAFSTALNASVLHIDGANQTSQDSDQVKLDIDTMLQGAFEGDQPVAVIHRFEELPPGSTLIFYRYCDHENAAYKKTFLIFTVLLGEEEEIPTKIRLSTVEEMVDDHLQKKFLSHDQPVSFDRMDLDKYGGLWSRISHLILPVAAEETIELVGCQSS